MVHNDCLDGVGLDEKEKGRCDSIVFTFTDDSELKNDLIEFRPGVRMILNSYIRSPSHGVDRRGCDPCLLMPHPVQLYVFYSTLLTPLAGVWHVCTIPYIQEWLSISLHHNHKLWFLVNSINLYPILLVLCSDRWVAWDRLPVPSTQNTQRACPRLPYGHLFIRCEWSLNDVGLANCGALWTVENRS